MSVMKVNGSYAPDTPAKLPVVEPTSKRGVGTSETRGMAPREIPLIPQRQVRTSGIENEISIDTGKVELGGTIGLPKRASSIVLFAHGSGSSRFSPRNRYVAQALQAEGIGTLLFDLLTRVEESVDEVTAEFRFDISFLAERLYDVTRWLLERPETKQMKFGYFGASTGVAAALVTAAALQGVVGAIVSRGGRPDLAGKALTAVRCPTLLIVGGNDQPVIKMNRYALVQLRCEKRLVIVPHATHLFEEPGALEEVARLAVQWFKTHLAAENAAQAEMLLEK
jgi:putative phosphoribosyl transferase